MFKPIISRAISVLSVGLLLGGCSTLEVRDTYRPTGGGTTLPGYTSDDVKLHVAINPDTRFYSIGMLGIPIIPTYVKSTDPTEITLAIGLTLRRNHDFSFASRPCLIDEKSEMICPYRAEVSAVGMYQDDGSMYADKRKRWHKVRHFYKAENRILSLPIVPGSNSIDRDRIYQHYDYKGAQKWGYLRVDFAFKYKCEGACPERLDVNIKDLVTVGTLPIQNKSYTFEKARQKDYRFITEVQ